MALSIVTPPTGEIVTLAEAKAYLRVDDSDDNELIESLIKAAREHIEGPEGGLNRLFLTQTWDLTIDAFPSNEIMIPLAPLQSVVEVVYRDELGIEMVIAPEDYVVDVTTSPPWVLPVIDVDWPTTINSANAVRVRFVGGYWPAPESESGANGIAANVPGTVKLAVKMLVSHWYDRRELFVESLISEIPRSVSRLLSPYRLFL